MAARRDQREREIVDVRTRAQFRTWLKANHERSDGVWLTVYKKHVSGDNMDVVAVAEEALCYGWIDSTSNTLDDEKYLVYIAPRKRGSVWSKPNKERVGRLVAEGRMQPPGQAVIDRAKADGSWTVLDTAENLEEPEDLSAALDEVSAARRNWDGFTAGARKVMLGWIATAKKPETRARRIAKIVSEAKAGRRAFG